MNIGRSGEWRSSDKAVFFRFPYHDRRDKFAVSAGGVNFKNSTSLINPVTMQTYENPSAILKTGAWHVNHTEEVFSFLVNGIGGRQVSVLTVRCLFNCTLPPKKNVNITEGPRFWSINGDW